MKRVATVVGGFALLLAGLALLVLPGPGIPLVAAGLGLLSLEYAWARRLRERVLRRAEWVAPKRRSRRIAAGAAALAAAIGGFAAALAVGLPGF